MTPIRINTFCAVLAVVACGGSGSGNVSNGDASVGGQGGWASFAGAGASGGTNTGGAGGGAGAGGNPGGFGGIGGVSAGGTGASGGGSSDGGSQTGGAGGTGSGGSGGTGSGGSGGTGSGSGGTGSGGSGGSSGLPSQEFSGVSCRAQDCVVVWLESKSLYGARVAANGQLLNQPQPLAPLSWGAPPEDTYIASAPTHHFVVWVSKLDDAVHGVRISATTGKPDPSPMQIAAAPSNGMTWSNPAVAYNSSNGLFQVAAFLGDFSSSSLQFARVSTASQLLNPMALVTPTKDESWNITWTQSGTTSILGHVDVGNQYATRIASSGSILGTPVKTAYVGKSASNRDTWLAVGSQLLLVRYDSWDHHIYVDVFSSTLQPVSSGHTVTKFGYLDDAAALGGQLLVAWSTTQDFYVTPISLGSGVSAGSPQKLEAKYTTDGVMSEVRLAAHATGYLAVWEQCDKVASTLCRVRRVALNADGKAVSPIYDF